MAPLYLLLLGHLLLVISAFNGGNHRVIMEVEEEELLGLFEVLGSLLDDPTWAQMHPQPCTESPWPGVGCELDQDQDPPIFHITKIHISPDISNPPCKPSAYFSQSLEKLPFLKTLTIFNCFTKSPVSLPSSIFGKMTSSLEHLTLESNPSLIGKIPPILGQAQNLRVLCLPQNNFEGEIPKELRGLVNLEQLDLSYNNLSGQIPEIFGGLKSLSILDLSHNSLEGHLPISLGKLHLLQKLDLGCNKLNGLIPPNLGYLEMLVLMDLSYNLLNEQIPFSFSNMGNLEYLLLDHNPINSEFPSFLSTLKKVKTLSFSRCGLIGKIPTSISSLRNLSALSLDNNHLSGTVPQSLGSLPDVGELNLSQNQLSGELSLPEEFIFRLGKRLDVRGNKGLCIWKMSHIMKNVYIYLPLPYCMKTSMSSDNSTMKQASVFNGMPISTSPWLHHLDQLLSTCFVLFILML